MDAPDSKVFFPATVQELFSQWQRTGDAAICAGGTGFILAQGQHAPRFPDSVISLQNLKELTRISRTERYLEIGSMVTLNKIINLGKILPQALNYALRRVAGLQVRNQATIGGNICFPSGKLDSAVPMIALDAQYELRTVQSSRWISAAQFSASPSPPLESGELLTRIRIPLEPWAFTAYRKFHSAGSTTGEGSILFAMNNEKNILTKIRVLYSDGIILREKNSETIFRGKRLPLDKKDADAFLDSWRNYLATLDSTEHNGHLQLIRLRIINFITTMLRHISD